MIYCFTHSYHWHIIFYNHDNKRISSRRQVRLIGWCRTFGNGQRLCQSPYGNKAGTPQRRWCMPSGAIFTLADVAFAAATNSHARLTLSITSSINFFKAESKGFLYAEAREAFSHKRLANCEVRITNETGDLIATFNGTGYRKDTELPFAPIE